MYEIHHLNPLPCGLLRALLFWKIRTTYLIGKATLDISTSDINYSRKPSHACCDPTFDETGIMAKISAYGRKTCKMIKQILIFWNYRKSITEKFYELNLRQISCKRFDLWVQRMLYLGVMLIAAALLVKSIFWNTLTLQNCRLPFSLVNKGNILATEGTWSLIWIHLFSPFCCGSEPIFMKIINEFRSNLTLYGKVNIIERMKGDVTLTRGTLVR